MVPLDQAKEDESVRLDSVVKMPSPNKKRKHRTLLTLSDEKKTQVDADDWHALLKFCTAWTGREADWHKRNLEDLVESIEIDGENSDKRIISFSVGPPFLVAPRRDRNATASQQQPLERETSSEKVSPSFLSPQKPAASSVAGGLECLDKLELHAMNTKVSELSAAFPNLRQLTLRLPWSDVVEDSSSSIFFACKAFSKLKALSVEALGRAIPEDLGCLGPCLENLSITLNADSNQNVRYGQYLLPSSSHQLTNLKSLKLVYQVVDRNCFAMPPCELFNRSVPISWAKLQRLEIPAYLLSGLSQASAKLWPNLCEATLHITACNGSLGMTHRSFVILSSWKKLKRLTITLDQTSQGDNNGDEEVVSIASSGAEDESNFAEGDLERPVHLPFHLLLGSSLLSLEELSINTRIPLRSDHHPWVQLSLSDIGSAFPKLKTLTLQRCQFAAPNKDPNAKASSPSESLFSRLVCMDLTECCEFFAPRSTTVDFLASDIVDLSSLEVLGLADFQEELGDDELLALCTRVLRKCSKLRELCLPDGSIGCLDMDTGTVSPTSSPNHNIHAPAGDLFVSCLPKDTLKILELSRNPALNPSSTDQDQAARNIQLLWNLVAQFALLGFVGRFNNLFLGNRGENYHRLDEYYRIIHHLAINRARSRVLSNQTVPLGLWANIFHKAQRAFDDYPGHIIGKNRKTAPDAIFNLLQERGAEDIFK